MPETSLSPYGSQFVAKKAFFKLLGDAFRIYGPGGDVLQFYVKQKAFKLREEITVFKDEAQSTAMLRIKARQALDVSATYDVTDAMSGERVGALRRRGLMSIVRDEWMILGEGDSEVGKIQEDNAALAIVRRFIPLIPQSFTVTMGDKQVGVVKQRFNPFQLIYDVDFTADSAGALDRRLGVALVVLLLAIEGRQQS